MEQEVRRIDLAMAEFTDIIDEYILPLFDVRGRLKSKMHASNNTELISFTNNNGKKVVRFYPCIATKKAPSPFYCEISSSSSESVKRPAIQILRELLKVAEFGCWNGFIRKQRDYGSSNSRQLTYKQRTLDIAFEVGMCYALTPSYPDASTMHSIVCRMVEWSTRTYEGKNVPFGIAVNFDTEAPEENADYLHFLNNDSSAAFTDGIFSGIMLDKKGKLLNFLTRNSKVPETDPNWEVFVPYQFADFAKHCIRNTIGIVVLTNGEILLIKDQSVCFAKRGNKWVYFDWQRVSLGLEPYFLAGLNISKEEAKRRSKEIYCTLLDVSFSHTGGCLALLLPNPQTNLNKVIKERFDLSIIGQAPDGISKESQEKIEILKYLLSDVRGVRSFFDVEKPLRREILGLDGATVVSLDGSFYCAGSIVSVPSGSSGGGRTAAAKKLAELGVGIKISEDGYIEAYGSPVKIEKDEKNTRIVPLFKIK